MAVCSITGQVIRAEGKLSGACFCASAQASLLAGALVGALGAVMGTLGGYQARTRLVSGLKVRDVFVAVPKDLVAIGFAFLLMFIG
ncbi:MAG: hypothetical protein ACRD3T_08860 [Terriglobia bacterium]